MSGWFVREQCRHLAQDEGVDLTVLAPAHAGSPDHEREGRIEVRRLRYFLPASLQRLAYGSGVISNLKSCPLAWLNLIPFALAFCVATVRLGRSAELIHAHWGPMGALALLTRPFHRRPVILSVHGSDILGAGSLVRCVTAWAVRRSDAVCANTPVSQQAAARFRPDPDSCRCILSGLFLPDLDGMLAARRARTDNAVRIISVGRLVSERRYDLLIRALAPLQSRASNVTLSIIGDGPQRRTLQRLIENLDLTSKVHLVGQVDRSRISAYLAEADIYVSATEADNFANAVLEGAAHALPVVATRVGFPAEVVIDGRTGFLIESGDLDALCEAIGKLVDAPEKCREFGMTMRRRVEELGLTWSTCAAETAQLYRDVLLKTGRATMHNPRSS